MNRELIYNYYQESGSPRSRYLSTSDSSDQENNNSQVTCNCNRSLETIKCKNCGETFIGRKQILCHQHKNIIHLMDFSFCIYCKRRL